MEDHKVTAKEEVLHGTQLHRENKNRKQTKKYWTDFF